MRNSPSPEILLKTERTLEQVRLVEEQDDARLCEPSTVRDGLEQSRRFVHPVNVRVLVKCLVVLRDGDEEDEDVDILKAMNPEERESVPPWRLRYVTAKGASARMWAKGARA